MTETDQHTDATEEKKVEGTDAKSESTSSEGAGVRGRGRSERPERGDRRMRRGRAARKPRSEYDTKILDIRRVTRVVAGGRRFSFSVTLVLGNGKGQVGVGIGKAGDTALAIDKATRNAKKHIVHVPLTADLSIPHEVQAKYDASEILLIPTPGRGFKAGSAPRTVLEFAGVKNVSAKILSRSKNQLNNARATVEALRSLKAIPHKMQAHRKFEKSKSDKGRHTHDKEAKTEKKAERKSVKGKSSSPKTVADKDKATA